MQEVMTPSPLHLPWAQGTLGSGASQYQGRALEPAHRLPSKRQKKRGCNTA